MNSCFAIEKEETVWSGRLMDVRIVTIKEDRTEVTRISEREMAVRYHRVVCVLPITADGRLMLIRQPRIYYNECGMPEVRTTLEFPAGKVGDVCPDEQLESAARRELEEETGYYGGGFVFLCKESVSAGILSEERHCFLAQDILPGKKEESDESRLIEVLLVRIEDVTALIESEIARGIEIDSGVRSMLFAYFAAKNKQGGNTDEQEG